MKNIKKLQTNKMYWKIRKRKKLVKVTYNIYLAVFFGHNLTSVWLYYYYFFRFWWSILYVFRLSLLFFQLWSLSYCISCLFFTVGEFCILYSILFECLLAIENNKICNWWCFGFLLIVLDEWQWRGLKCG